MKNKIIIIFLLTISFSYGVTVGIEKKFPYETLKYIKNILSNDLAVKDNSVQEDKNLEVKFEKVLKSGNRYIKTLDSYSSKIQVDCLESSSNLGVLVAFGQSNSANSSKFLVPESRVPDVINYHKGKCFLASSPLLGATGKSGEWISLLAQELVSNGTYKSVIVMSLGIGGSPIAAWTEGSPLNKNLILNLKKISATYKITDIIFHQGESDARWLISSNIYITSFTSLVNSIRKIGVTAPMFLSIASYCSGTPSDYPNNITSAQIQAINSIDGVFLGPNTDTPLNSKMRYNDCHFNKLGQELLSKKTAELIKHFHKSN